MNDNINPIFTPGSDAIGAGVERFFAVAKPIRQSVMLIFERGSVELSLAESEAISGCLAQANTILRGAHPVQSEGDI